MMTIKKKLSLKLAIFTVLSAFLILFSPISSVVGANLEFYAFTNLGCEPCVEKLQPLLNLYGQSVTTYDIRESNNSELFSKIVSLVGSGSYTATPLVVVFKDDTFAAVVFGVHAQKEWEEIVKAGYDGVPVYSNLYNITDGTLLPDKILTDQNVTESITRLFAKEKQGDHIDGPRTLYSLFTLVVMAALVDAVNPCEFYVLAVFLSLVFFRVGRETVLKAGLAYAIAIFASYYLLGIGILRLLDYGWQVRFVVVATFGFFGLVVGFREIMGAILGKEIKRVPDSITRNLSARLRKASESSLSAFIIGLASGIFLLPCTSAPYFIALSLIADLESLLEGLLLLTVYNGIIVVPFIAITLCIYSLQLRTGDLKKWSARRQKWLNFTSGLLIVVLGLYLLSTLIV